MDNKNALQIVRKAKLTKGQKSLLELINEKIESNEIIKFNEAKEIYLSQVCNSVINGIPMQYDYYHEQAIGIDGKPYWKSALVPMSEFTLAQYVTQWLVTNIGSLVMKGYLKVMPNIELKQLI